MMEKSICFWNIGPFAPFSILKNFYFTLSLEASNSHKRIADCIQRKVFSWFDEGGEGLPFICLQAKLITPGSFCLKIRIKSHFPEAINVYNTFLYHHRKTIKVNYLTK